MTLSKFLFQKYVIISASSLLPVSKILVVSPMLIFRTYEAMGVGSGGPWPPTSWILIYGTDMVNKGFIVLFFGLFLLFGNFILEIFLPTPLYEARLQAELS